MAKVLVLKKDFDNYKDYFSDLVNSKGVSFVEVDSIKEFSRLLSLIGVGIVFEEGSLKYLRDAVSKKFPFVLIYAIKNGESLNFNELDFVDDFILLNKNGRYLIEKFEYISTLISKKRKVYLDEKRIFCDFSDLSYRIFRLFENKELIGLFFKNGINSLFFSFINDLILSQGYCFFAYEEGRFLLKYSEFPNGKVLNELWERGLVNFINVVFENGCYISTNSRKNRFIDEVFEMLFLGINVAFPVFLNGEKIGVVCYADKVNGDKLGENEVYFLNELFSKKLVVERKNLVEKESIVIENEENKNVEKEEFKQLQSEKNYIDVNDVKDDILNPDSSFSFLQMFAMRSSHEIKNALVSIKTFTQLLPRKYKSEAFRRDFFKVVSREVERLDEIIEEILFFSQPVRINKEKVDLVKLVKKTAEEVSKSFKSINFEYDDDISSGKVYCDSALMKKAVGSIIRNAADSMKGEGTVRIYFLNSSYLGKKGISVRFSDSGCGIPDNIRDRIFDPFFSTKTRGLGLGLTIAKKIIESHHGKLKIEKEGVGTSVEIFIPDEKGESIYDFLSKEKDNIGEYDIDTFDVGRNKKD